MYKQNCVAINCSAAVIALLLLWARLNVNAEDSSAAKPLTEACLTCLCEAQSGCNSSAICVNGACGIFRITWAYWVDAGSPTYKNGTSLDNNAFTNCVNDPHCAADTVQAYMSKFGQDCDKDDKIDCLDYGALHKKGYLNCEGELPYIYARLFNECLETFQEQAADGEPLRLT